MDSWNIGCDFINDSGFGKDDDDIIHNYFSPTNVDHNIPHYSIHPHQPSSSNHHNFGTLKNQVIIYLIGHKFYLFFIIMFPN